MVSEFVAAINQICSERGISQESVYSTLEMAVLSAYKKETNKENVENLSVEMDRETGKFKLIAKKTVVKKVKNEEEELSLKEAVKASKKLKEGDVVEIELPIADFGRIAAQTAKQAILQKINELERQSILDEYSNKVGQVFTAMMQRMQRGQAVFEIGKAMSYMPPEEQIPNEFYKIGERYKVLLKEIRDNLGAKFLVVSRADPKFLEELFKLEVPEMESEAVQVKACAREAGSRSKIAVVSNQEGIDPIGACVGQKGMRIANVMSELGIEKIDIIEWDEELEKFVVNALSPAKVESVRIENDIAYVKVPDDQLSLAIGKDGQNVRLAYKLTGIKIDIQGLSVENEKETDTVEEKVTAKENEKKTKKSVKPKTKKTKEVKEKKKSKSVKVKKEKSK